MANALTCQHALGAGRRVRRAGSRQAAEAPELHLPGGHPFGRQVAPGVLGQVVAAHEAAVAHGAGKALLAGVCAAVPRQLVGAGEVALAALPVAAERLLACRGRQRHKQNQNLVVRTCCFLLTDTVIYIIYV